MHKRIALALVLVARRLHPGRQGDALAREKGSGFSEHWSFVKRRLGLAPSSQAVGLDQIPESLLPLTALDVAVATTLFFAGELLLSRLLYRWHVRDRPY